MATTPLRRLARSSGRPGFAPALDVLIEELQSALVSPSDLAARAEDLEDGAHEAELVALYTSYSDLREQAGRTDRGALAAAVLAALRADPSSPPARSSPTASTT